MRYIPHILTSSGWSVISFIDQRNTLRDIAKENILKILETNRRTFNKHGKKAPDNFPAFLIFFFSFLWIKNIFHSCLLIIFLLSVLHFLKLSHFLFFHRRSSFYVYFNLFWLLDFFCACGVCVFLILFYLFTYLFRSTLFFS